MGSVQSLAQTTPINSHSDSELSQIIGHHWISMPNLGHGSFTEGSGKEAGV